MESMENLQTEEGRGIEANMRQHTPEQQRKALGSAHLGSGEALVPAGFRVLARLQRIVVLLDARR